MLKRMDLAALEASHRKGNTSANDEPAVEVDASDTAGVKGILASLKAKAGAVYAKKPAA